MAVSDAFLSMLASASGPAPQRKPQAAPAPPAVKPHTPEPLYNPFIESENVPTAKIPSSSTDFFAKSTRPATATTTVPSQARPQSGFGSSSTSSSTSVSGFGAARARQPLSLAELSAIAGSVFDNRSSDNGPKPALPKKQQQQQLQQQQQQSSSTSARPPTTTALGAATSTMDKTVTLLSGARPVSGPTMTGGVGAHCHFNRAQLNTHTPSNTGAGTGIGTSSTSGGITRALGPREAWELQQAQKALLLQQEKEKQRERKNKRKSDADSAITPTSATSFDINATPNAIAAPVTVSNTQQVTVGLTPSVTVSSTAPAPLIARPGTIVDTSSLTVSATHPATVISSQTTVSTASIEPALPPWVIASVSVLVARSQAWEAYARNYPTANKKTAKATKADSKIATASAASTATASGAEVVAPRWELGRSAEHDKWAQYGTPKADKTASLTAAHHAPAVTVANTKQSVAEERDSASDDDDDDADVSFKRSQGLVIALVLAQRALALLTAARALPATALTLTAAADDTDAEAAATTENSTAAASTVSVKELESAVARLQKQCRKRELHDSPWALRPLAPASAHCVHTAALLALAACANNNSNNNTISNSSSIAMGGKSKGLASVFNGMGAGEDAEVNAAAEAASLSVWGSSSSSSSNSCYHSNSAAAEAAAGQGYLLVSDSAARGVMAMLDPQEGPYIGANPLDLPPLLTADSPNASAAGGSASGGDNATAAAASATLHHALAPLLPPWLLVAAALLGDAAGPAAAAGASLETAARVAAAARGLVARRRRLAAAGGLNQAQTQKLLRKETPDGWVDAVVRAVTAAAPAPATVAAAESRDSADDKPRRMLDDDDGGSDCNDAAAGDDVDDALSTDVSTVCASAGAWRPRASPLVSLALNAVSGDVVAVAVKPEAVAAAVRALVPVAVEHEARVAIAEMYPPCGNGVNANGLLSAVRRVTAQQQQLLPEALSSQHGDNAVIDRKQLKRQQQKQHRALLSLHAPSGCFNWAIIGSNTKSTKSKNADNNTENKEEDEDSDDKEDAELEKALAGLIRGSLLIPREGTWARVFPYQRESLLWLWGLSLSAQRGGMLGDDMGLGKTVQVAAYLRCVMHTAAGGAVAVSANTAAGTGTAAAAVDARARDASGYSGVRTKALVVVPLATVAQWVSELGHWAPGARVSNFGEWTSKQSRENGMAAVWRKGGVVVITPKALSLNVHLLNHPDKNSGTSTIVDVCIYITH